MAISKIERNSLGFSGAVLQVVSATTNTQVSSSTDTFVATGLTASITPTSATSKILVLVQHNGCRKTVGNSSTCLDIQLVKNSSPLIQTGALAETGTSSDLVVSCGFSYLDSPATTSSVTYATNFRSRNNTASVQVQYANLSNSQIVLLEIAA